MRERILCIANSRKHQGHCIAGLTTRGKLIRLCGPSGAALSDADTDLGLMGQPRVLDELDVKLARPIPDGHQPENWLIADGALRVSSRKAPSHWGPSIEKAREPSSVILGNDQPVISAEDAVELGRSLELIRPKDLHFRMRWRPGLRIPRFRAAFRYRGAEYDLPVTDPSIERELRKDKDVLNEKMHLPFPRCPGGGDLYATVSIGEEYQDGMCYKLVAALFCVPW